MIAHNRPIWQPWLLTLGLGLLLATSAFAEEVWFIAGSEQQLTQTEARELILDGKYKMTKVTEGELTRAILYNSTDELTPYLPAAAIERMNRPVEWIDPLMAWSGKKYPDFEFTGLDGSRLRSADLAGRVAVLNFWFIACLPCVEELPVLNQLVEHYAESEVNFVAATFDPAEKVTAFLAKRPFDYQQTTLDHSLLQKLSIGAFPTHVILGRDGKMRAFVTGLAGGSNSLRDELSKEIDAALAGD